MPCRGAFGLAARPWSSVSPPDMQDPGSVAVRLDLCKMDASWNSVPDANVRRSPSCVRASCISSRLWAQVGHAMPDRLNRPAVAKSTLPVCKSSWRRDACRACACSCACVVCPFSSVLYRQCRSAAPFLFSAASGRGSGHPDRLNPHGAFC
ncbi:hypothetical protein V8C34DRAFT_289890 [Trichoderma compactum]